MASSGFPSVVTGVTVNVASAGAISGDGSSGNKLAVGVDGVTMAVNGSNQLAGAGSTTTVTTASLVGKTMTFTGGVLTGFA